jgi:hypothetical protein
MDKAKLKLVKREEMLLSCAGGLGAQTPCRCLASASVAGGHGRKRA